MESDLTPVLHRPQKMAIRRFLHKSTTGSTSTCVFFWYDLSSFCHNSSHTFDPKTPPGDGLLGALTTVWQSDSSFRALLSTTTLSLKLENVVPQGSM